MSVAYKIPENRNQWENTFTVWAQPPSKAEKHRCENAIREISEAIHAHPRLHQRGVKTFPQGSYANRVNVRKDSDVDVCCLHGNVFFSSLPVGYSRSDFDIVDAGYAYSDYKEDVEQSLVSRFGRPAVVRGNKAIDVNCARLGVDADVVATFEYRQYYIENGRYDWHSGTALKSDRENKLITNFPQQQYDNGVAKNDATSRRFKKQVRIQKCLRNRMENQGVAVAKPMTSFLLESLCWCAPTSCYGHNTLFSDFEAVLEWQYKATETDQTARQLLEINGIKPLFGLHNDWTRSQVQNFIAAAWRITH